MHSSQAPSCNSNVWFLLIFFLYSSTQPILNSWKKEKNKNSSNTYAENPVLDFDIITAWDENILELSGELDLPCELLCCDQSQRPHLLKSCEKRQDKMFCCLNLLFLDVQILPTEISACSSHWSSWIYPFMVDLQFQMQL